MPLASVLIPIHNKSTTLPLTVDTVLRQSVEDLEVLLIGDGVTDEVRCVAEQLVAADPRVRFLDFPKGPHHGERYRHDAIEAANSDAIFYLCDDDLLLPEHVADLLALLQDHDLVQCLNGWVTDKGEVRLYAADLADPDVRALHLRDDVRFNAVSITGTAHTRSAYRRVSPWDTTPDGWWPDHWQFRQMLAAGFRAATSPRMTALQFPTSADGRDAWSPEARAEEVVPWHDLVTSPGGQEEIDRLVGVGMLPQLVEERVRTSETSAALATAYAELAAVRGALANEREALAAVREALAAVREALAGERARRDELARTHDGVVAVLQQEIDRLRGRVARLVEVRARQKEKIAALRARLRDRRDELRRLRGRKS